MATIQLDQDVLTAERLIDGRDQDSASRQLLLLHARYKRRPEYRYLQALFDATFAIRSDAELIRDVSILVAEQPDFTEAVALLSVLYQRVGDSDRAVVFAREAIHARNPNAQQRARWVLEQRSTRGAVPRSVPADTALSPSPPPQPDGSQMPWASGVAVSPLPSAITEIDKRPTRRATQQLVSVEASEKKPEPSAVSSAPRGLELVPYTSDAGVRKPTLEGLAAVPAGPDSSRSRDSLLPADESAALLSEVEQAPRRHSSTLVLESREVRDMQPLGEGQTPVELEPTWVAASDPIEQAELAAHLMDDSQQHGPVSVETIAFAPLMGNLPPPPMIPSEVRAQADQALRSSELSREDKDHKPQGTSQARLQANASLASEPSVPDSAKGEPSPESASSVALLTPELAVDRTGVGRSWLTRQSSRPTPVHPAAAASERQWFRVARSSQVERLTTSSDASSTAETLLDLAERIVEGKTPLFGEPVPLDRRGLVMIEQRLDALRSARTPSDRPAGTAAAAAFLLALMLKECDGRAVDTSSDDGACRVVLPSGASLRPLWIAASFARNRSLSLVETYDRLATAHARRPSWREASGRERTTERDSSESALEVLEAHLALQRRDLDAGTMAVRAVEPIGLTVPMIDMQAIASEFCASALGAEIAGESLAARTGFSVELVGAIERHLGRVFSLVGCAPPGSPWPWGPSEELNELIVSLGAVLGQVLTTRFAGSWEADPVEAQDVFLMRVALRGGVVCWPIAQVYLRLARGIGHDLVAYVQAVEQVVARVTGQSHDRSK